MIDEPVELIPLPSPEEVLAERMALIDAATVKLQKLGLTLDEAKAVIGV